MTDTRWLMCLPRTEIPGTAAEIRACTCGTDVWFSREMCPEVDAKRVHPLCPTCIGAHMEPDARAEVHPAQTENLTKLGLLGYADQVVTAFNRSRPEASEGWTGEPRFAAFREAYSYATGHFSMAAPAFAKLSREEAFSIWHCIQLGMEKQGAPTNAHQASVERDDV
jgi:hypothetical protein